MRNEERDTEAVRRDYPTTAGEWLDAVTRRGFLQYMGASLALAGVGACTRQPPEKTVPYGSSPESTVPGRPRFFATAMPLTGGAAPLLVESHMGRPTKIEGNPAHPASLGGSHALAQASILDLYDPDRSQVVKRGGRILSWSAFLTELRSALDAVIAKDGAGLAILTETVISPTLADQLWNLASTLPEVAWHQYEPINRDAARAGALLAFEEDTVPLYRFDRADVVLALDADFLGRGGGSVRYARDFAGRRSADALPDRFNRLYAVESTPSITGAKADHRLPLRPAGIESIARALAGELGIVAPTAEGLPAAERKWVGAVARDLEQHRGTGLVVAGDEQSAVVHALAHAVNEKLGNVGTTVVLIDPPELEPVDHAESLGALAADMEAGKVEILLILGGNPVYTAPADMDFAALLGKVGFTAHLGLHEDETSAECGWHIPARHFLEDWSDLVAYDGTTTIVQPLIAPLYQGRSPHELVATLAGQVGRTSHDLVRAYWEDNAEVDDFEPFWRRVLHDGIVPDTAMEPKDVSVKEDLADRIKEAKATRPESGLDIVFRPDATVWDGRFANNAWLQELPKPLTLLTWDNAVILSPATASRLGLENGRVVDLSYQGRALSGPVWVLPGQAEDCVTLHLGYGRTCVGRVGSGTGCNAYVLRTSGNPGSGSGCELRATERTYALSSVQEHSRMEGRAPVRTATLEEFRRDDRSGNEGQAGNEEQAGNEGQAGGEEQAGGEGQAGGEEAHELASLHAPIERSRPAWAMSIDLTGCTGCSACVVACQAENNVPVVGKSEVALGREMHWIRVDRYFEGDADRVHHQPVPCMQCENAPCELVCPVGATVHSSEGLNDMVYNRCVGTRYCSNNCPYKVRRFNFYRYADDETEILKLQRNPDVTVRSRGVMEKCTYCVQRINAARIHARKEGREIRDGEVVTACQAACPSRAISFGDLLDPKSEIARVREAPHRYALLEELGVRPRTTYLSEIRNPNPELES